MESGGMKVSRVRGLDGRVCGWKDVSSSHKHKDDDAFGPSYFCESGSSFQEKTKHKRSTLERAVSHNDMFVSLCCGHQMRIRWKYVTKYLLLCPHFWGSKIQIQIIECMEWNFPVQEKSSLCGVTKAGSETRLGMSVQQLLFVRVLQPREQRGGDVPLTYLPGCGFCAFSAATPSTDRTAWLTWRCNRTCACGPIPGTAWVHAARWSSARRALDHMSCSAASLRGRWGTEWAQRGRGAGLQNSIKVS